MRHQANVTYAARRARIAITGTNFVFAGLLAIGACAHDSTPPSEHSPSPNQATATPVVVTPDASGSSAAPSRPAAISESDIRVMDRLLATLIALDEAIRGQRDCKAAANSVGDAVRDAGSVLSEAARVDRRTRADEQATAWAFEHYGTKIGPLIKGIMSHACARDRSFKTAVAKLVGAP